MHDRPLNYESDDAESLDDDLDTDLDDDLDEDPEAPQECDLDDDPTAGDIYDAEPCPACGKDVSELADRCPHCGTWIVQGPARLNPRSVAFVALGIFLVLLILLLVL